MAFPTVAGLQETTVASMSTTHNISLGATVNAGDLLVMIFVGSQVGADQTYTITDPSGFTLLFEDQFNVAGQNRQHTGVYYKVATGSEGGTTVNVATSASVSAVAHVYRITTGTHNSAVEASTRSEAEAANPNPPSLTPSWGSADTLWIAVATWEDSDFFATAAPSSYTNLTTEIADSTEDAVISSARRENATGTEDAGAFTADSEKHQAFVLAIQPAGGGGGGGFYLVHEEDGTSRFTLEDDSGFLILEEAPNAYEESLSVTITGTTTLTDTADFQETQAQTITATTTADDNANFVDGLAVTITSTVTATDTYTPASGPQNYDETGKAFTITSTTTGSDTADFAEGIAVEIVGTILGSDTYNPADHFTESLEVAGTVTTTADDNADFQDTLTMILEATLILTDEHAQGPFGKPYLVAVFYRNDGALVWSYGADRSMNRGFRASEGYERASDKVRIPESHRISGQADDAIDTAWIANQGAPIATLRAAVNAALNAAGYRAPDGSLLDT